MRTPSSHVSYSALLAALLALVLAIAAAAEILAHHPGSHASRQGDGRVRLELSAVVSDACTAIASVERGAPPNVQAPKGADPVTARLQRPNGVVCATVVTAVRRETMLDVPAGMTTLHVFVVGPEGVRGTERVPIR